MRSKVIAGIVALAAVAIAQPVAAQFNAIAQDARSGALGGSLFFAPAERYISLGYRANYLLGSMADKSLCLQLPVASTGTVVASYLHHGDAVYHEQQFALGYALPVSDKIMVGVGGRYLHLGTSDAHYELQQWLAASVLMRASFGRTTLTFVGGTRPWDDRQRWRMHLQAAYRPTVQLLSLVELEQEERLRLRMGLEYNYRQSLFFRVGAATRPTVLTFGLGVKVKHYAVNVAAEMHSHLGLTPHTSLSLWF